MIEGSSFFKVLTFNNQLNELLCYCLCKTLNDSVISNDSMVPGIACNKNMYSICVDCGPLLPKTKYTSALLPMICI